MDDELTRRLEEQMEEVKRSFVDSLPERLAQIEGGHRAFEEGDAEARAILHRHVHSLHGAAATLGFEALAEEARLLELTIAAAVAGGMTSGRAGAMATGVERVRRAIASCEPPAPSSARAAAT